jgi:parallel beta-helix repeat protein
MTLRGLALWLMAACLVARAEDGVTELTQDMMPLTISTSGSYRLTEDLVGTNGQHGITIATNHVQLDLNGYTLRGVPGSSNGIAVNPALPLNALTVINGRIVHWDGLGVFALSASNSVYRGLVVANNGYGGLTNYQGMWVGESCVIEDCVFASNRWNGVEAESGATVLRCVAVDNGDHGFDIHSSSVIEDCQAVENNHDGFHLSHAVSVRRCVAVRNGVATVNGAGIEVDTGSTVEDCAATGNGDDGFKSNGQSRFVNCVAEGNMDDGFDVDDHMSVVACQAVRNGVAALSSGVGIQVGSYSFVSGCLAAQNGNGAASSAGYRLEGGITGCRLENNVAVSNNPTGFRVQGESNMLMGNVASGNLTDEYLIDAGNVAGLASLPGTNLPSSVWLNFDL